MCQNNAVISVILLELALKSHRFRSEVVFCSVVHLNHVVVCFPRVVWLTHYTNTSPKQTEHRRHPKAQELALISSVSSRRLAPCEEVAM